MARLVIVSNRVPSLSKREQQSGGLAVALHEALKDEALWFGWSGRIAGETGEKPAIATRGSITYATIDLGENDYRHYYAGFANSSLWPLLHYRSGLVAFSREDYRGYRATNGKFAAALSKLIAPDDLIWVHDYHLIPLAQALRALGCRNRIGFFLHIPFPPPSFFEILPPAGELLADLSAYDVTGFQTERDRRNFFDCFLELGAAQTDKAARVMKHAVAIPVGIDAAEFQKIARKVEASEEVTRLRESLAGRKLIIGADRLDYSKGLPERFRAYSELLARYPQHRQKVSYLQVAARSREDVSEYRDLKKNLDRLTGAVNGKYAEFDWVPLRYLTRGIQRDLLAGFFRYSAVGLVVPLRDGMNLVAKEYVAAQDERDPGVLILSRFAGAAQSLDAALIINPYDPSEIAEALDRALTMPHEERAERWRSLMVKVERESAAAWCRDFLAALSEARTQVSPPAEQPDLSG
jgi:trehalose 6-phosphate synthase